MHRYPEDYLMEHLDTRNRRLLDGGCGLGSSTMFLCQRIVAEGGTGRVIAIDRDLADLDYAEARLANCGLGPYATFICGDLEELEGVAPSSIDHAFLVNTVSWFESVPLRTIGIVAKLRDVLRPGGILSIMDQAPAGEDCGTWGRVWEAQKLLRILQGRAHLVEIPVERLVRCLEETGFTGVEHLVFAGEPLAREFTTGFIERLMSQAAGLIEPAAERFMASRLGALLEQIPETDLAPGTYVVHARR